MDVDPTEKPGIKANEKGAGRALLQEVGIPWT